MHLVGWFIWSYQLHSVLSTGTCKKYVPYCHHDIMVGWINATTVESQCPWTPIFGVSTFCDHLLQYHCFDIFVTGLDEFRWDHVVGDLTIFWGFQPFVITNCSRLHLKCDGTRAETRFRLSAKRTSLFKSAGGASSVLLAAEVCASAVVMLNTPCSEVVWRVLATHTIRQFPLHFPSRASPCAITFHLDSTKTENALRHTSIPQYVGVTWCLTH